MSHRILQPKPLTRDAFARYGEVIEVADENEQLAINYGMTTRHHDLARPDVAEDEGWPMLSIFRSQPLQLPFVVRIMERHPLGSQAFMPLSGHPYLVVVAPAGELDSDCIECFLAEPRQGVNYSKGTWHHYSLALGGQSDFLVIDRGGEGDNCEEVELPDTRALRIEGLA